MHCLHPSYSPPLLPFLQWMRLHAVICMQAGTLKACQRGAYSQDQLYFYWSNFHQRPRSLWVRARWGPTGRTGVTPLLCLEHLASLFDSSCNLLQPKTTKYSSKTADKDGFVIDTDLWLTRNGKFHWSTESSWAASWSLTKSSQNASWPVNVKHCWVDRDYSFSISVEFLTFKLLFPLTF